MESMECRAVTPFHSEQGALGCRVKSAKLLIMERKTGFEPATSSLGKCYYFDLKDLTNYGVHQVQFSFPSFHDLGSNGITEESRHAAIDRRSPPFI